MRRLDVIVRGATGRYVVIVQSDHLSDLETRLVIPLLPLGTGGMPATRLNPILRVDGIDHVLVTQHAAALKTAQLGRVIENLSGYRDEITSALDLLITGF